jgi:hypothetical protein
MIIPLDKIESTPGSHSRDYNYQWCYYKTSDNDTTYPINENTIFPEVLQIIIASQTGLPKPEIKTTYSVFYKIVNSDNAILPIPNNALKVWIEPEPYLNDVTREYDQYIAYAYFGNLEDAYNFSINNPIKT